MLNFSECTSFMLRLARLEFGGHLFPAYTAAEHELISLHFEMPRHDIGSFLLARRSLFGGGVPTHQPTFGVKVFLPTGMLHSRLHLRAPLPRTPSLPCSTSLLWTKDVLAYLYKIDLDLEDDTHWAPKFCLLHVPPALESFGLPELYSAKHLLSTSLAPP